MFKTSKHSHGAKPPGRLVSTEEVLPDLRSLAPMVDGPALRNRQKPSGFSSLKAVLGLFVTFAASLSAEAGDILRGGYSAQHQNSTGSVSSAGVVPSLQTNSGGQDRLSRTTQALQAVQKMQASAHQAAQNAGNKLGANLPNVPNGLTPGGLQVATGTGGKPVLWQGATLPTQATASSGQTVVTVTQTSADALLQWQTLNVGKNTTLNFDQSKGGSDASKWIVFNKILDPSGNPTQILGSINAPGQVYVINQNGIIFGGSSQINVHSLVASSLPVNDNLVNRGLLSTTPDIEFLLSALPTGSFTPTLAGTPTTDPSFAPGLSPITLAKTITGGTSPTIVVKPKSGSAQPLVAGTDYTISQTSGGKAIVTLTLAGLAKTNGGSVTISYAHPVTGTVSLTEPTIQLAQTVAAKTSPTVTYNSPSGTATLQAGSDYKLESVSGKSKIAFTQAGLVKLNGASVSVSYENSAHQQVADPATTPTGATYRLPTQLTPGTSPVFSVGSKQLVAGTDFTLNSATNTVTFLPSGLQAIEGKPLKVSYAGQVSDPSFQVSVTHELDELVATNANAKVTFGSGAAATTLTNVTDYTLTQETSGKSLLTLTTAGLQKLAAAPTSPQLTVSYNEAKFGEVVIEAGAELTSPSTAAHVGGKIALVGPNVTNAGTISTPDGQTILAAGYQVGFASHNSSDPSLRGLDTYIGQVPFDGSATNSGLIDAPRGDVTIAGKAVNQLGIIDSTTSVSLNGRIDLLASYNAVSYSSVNPVSAPYVSLDKSGPEFLPQATGSVTLGTDSVTRILPDLSSSETIIGTQLALPSVVNIQSLTTHLGTNALILAPNAMSVPQAGVTGNSALNAEGNVLSGGVSVSAGNWVLVGKLPQLVSTGGQIYFDSGAAIDVSGSANVPASISENIVSVQLLGAQLADSPLQRAGILHGQTINIDLRQTGTYNGFSWVGTPLADASGYIGLIQHNVGELTVAGGTVSLTSGSSVVMQPGSEINVSGGSIAYQGGMVQTTRLLSNGVLYDISQATPDLVYQGVYTGAFTTTSPKYGLAQTYMSSLLLNGAHYENGYTQGGNGGSITITSPSVALDGTLLGETTAGPRQRSTNSAASANNLPTPSSFSLIFQAQQLVAGNTSYTPYSPAAPSVSFDTTNNLPAADSFAVDSSGNPLPLRKERRSQVVLSPDLLAANGFGNLTVDNSDGLISIGANVSLNAPPTGSLTFLAANMDIEGKVSAPGGKLTFTVTDLSPYHPYFTAQAQYQLTNKTGPTADPTRGLFTLGPTASLSTAGLIVDDRSGSSTAGTLPLVANGGTITIKSYSANLASGSSIDASGGVIAAANGKQTYGNGGKIDIEAGLDQQSSGGSDLFIANGTLSLHSTMQAYAGPGASGGTLTLLAPLIQIGGSTIASNGLLLSPDFFSQGGFSNFNLTGLGAASNQPGRFVPAISIAPGTTVSPAAENWLVTLNPVDPNSITLTPTLLPEAQRTPVSLSFNAPGVTDYQNSLKIRGNLVLGEGSTIQTDAGGSVSFNGNTVAILGSIIAPGGTISIAGGSDSTKLGFSQTQAAATVEIGPNAVLSTAGTTVLSNDPRGFKVGTVVSGGKITISGNIVAEAGAVLDVSGATDVLDLRSAYADPTASAGPDQTQFLGYAMTPTRIDSNGGSITLKGSQELFTDATLLGAAGGPSAQGGSLAVSSGIFIAPASGKTQTPLDPTLLVTSSGSTIPTNLAGTDSTVIGAVAGNPNSAANSGLGHIAASSFAGGGFDSISLLGTVEFSGPVTIHSNGVLSVGARSNPSAVDGGVIFANQSVVLSAPYVQLGMAFQTPGEASIIRGHYAPTYGPGSLTIQGTLIDIGNLSLQNIGNATLVAANGDIRGDGTLDVQGRVTLDAGQIYPPTAVTFNIFAYDYQTGPAGKQTTHPGSVTILSSGERDLPLSAGGTLGIFASTISQGGVLRAPIGTINLGWDGSGTAPTTDPITGSLVAVPTTSNLALLSGSVTSVSAFDPTKGQGLIIPYGLNLNGTSWISPTGADITAGGVPGKTISLSGKNIVDEAGASIDLRGGGDILSYRFVSGTGGTNDILASNSSFAVIPGYQADYAPYASYNSGAASNPTIGANLGTDPGYVSTGLSVGDRVYLNAGYGLAAGYYTLLPARYALLPGAYLVTPQSGIPVGTQSLADGSSLTAGYRFNSFSQSQTGQPIAVRFEVDPASVVASRAQYFTYSGNNFLYQGAIDNNAAVPRLPMDGGQLIFEASQTLAIRGMVTATAALNGRGGLVDISSPSNIVISGSTGSASSGSLVLDASELSSFGAESLLIGGIRHFGSTGTTVSVETNSITVNNAGSPLTGPDIILVANQSLTLAPGADIESSGSLSAGAAPLLLNGDGVLLRVSTDPLAQISRSGVNIADTTPEMTISAGAHISGGSITLDSTHGTNLSQLAQLTATNLNLNSGQISIQLSNPGALQPTSGLILTSSSLSTIETGASAISLLSYSSIDVYGTGQVGLASLDTLALHAAEFRGFNNGGGTATFVANHIIIDNVAKGTAPGTIDPATGNIAFNANTITLGTNTVAIDQFINVGLTASGGILFQGTGGLNVPGALNISTPLLTGANGASESITAGGAVTIVSSRSRAAISAGLGASLSITGSNITENSNIILPSGTVKLDATAANPATGSALTIGGLIDTSGTAQAFFQDLVRYTDGGQITLMADQGAISINVKGIVDVSANPGGGNAGTLTISAPNGDFTDNGKFLGRAGSGGLAGTFSLDAGSLIPSNSTTPTIATLSPLGTALASGGFTQAVSIRDRNDQTVNVDGTIKVHNFALSADTGAIDVTGTIDASGIRQSSNSAGTAGGSIALSASGNITIESGGVLTVAGGVDNAAGKGGSVDLEAGSEINGTVGTGSVRILGKIDLTVDSITDPALDAELGLFSGTLHIRSPQATIGNTVVAPGSVIGASAIVLEGYQLYDLTSSGGTITTTVKNAVAANGATFVQNSSSLASTLFPGATNVVLESGAEIINRNGNVTLPADWDLGQVRFGPNGAPGVLTIRASGNLVFNGSLSDGFDLNNSPDGTLWNAPLLPQNTALPANVQSWSYRLTAGSDFTAADFHRVLPLSSLPANVDTGSLQLGISFTISGGGSNAVTDTSLKGHYQVIRTGTGDIDISAARNIELRNAFATIYTAGTQINLPTTPGDSGYGTITLPNGTQFDVPVPDDFYVLLHQIALGHAPNNLWLAQYSLAGGNVTLNAGQDILHQTQSGTTTVDDSEKQLPINWLYRRGSLDASGNFVTTADGDVASTTWWIDYSNFFEGVGALGGGNVTLIAGRDVKNVDAVVPTNAMMGAYDSAGNHLAPSNSNLFEFGGGDLVVSAGRNINGGVYYVERGQGTLDAGGQILTNATRAATVGGNAGTWLPTALFLGKGGFDISAHGNIVLGPVSNPFLLPTGLGNLSLYNYQSYFSTYSTSDYVDVTSIGGSITLKESATINGSLLPLLQGWLQNILLLSPSSLATSEPWLRLDVTASQIPQFRSAVTILPSTLEVTAPSGDINIVGNLTLSPSPTGTVDLAAKGSINALQPTGVDLGNNQSWVASIINLSDADPSSLPGPATPIPTISFGNIFNESGSTQGANGVLQTKEALHAAGILHASDLEPVHVYAETGSISGLELFSGKAARIVAGTDITDIAFYLQNDRSTDISVVAAGRDIIAYDPNSPLRLNSLLPGNGINGLLALAGDLQISGPGTLEVLAGRNLNLGAGRNIDDASDLDAGITSIGNARNPYLPFGGADIVAAAGIGSASSLAQSTIDFGTFISQFVSASGSSRYLSELLATLPTSSGLPTLSGASFEQLPVEQRDMLALELFYIVLRDAGRDHNDPTSSGFGNYDAGFSAITSLFPSAGQGDITLSSKSITTASGGNINIFAPGGQLSLGNVIQNPPPGIVTQDGGNISIFTHGNVDIGVERIFTLRGGNEIIWSSGGNIAAGSSSKTVVSAPPTRVLLDPQSGDVETDLAGLATGGGIGVLATVAGVAPGNVDLIAPTGTIDAGDAGIRATGNLSIAAVQVLNTSNIQVAGSSVGVPASTSVSAPSIAVSVPNNTAAAANKDAQTSTKPNQQQTTADDQPSIMTVEVIGYGGGDGSTTTDQGSGSNPTATTPGA